MKAQTQNPSTAEVQRLASDALEIAHRVGVSADYVRKVLRGDRDNAKILRAYQALLRQRSNAVQKFQKGTAK